VDDYYITGLLIKAVNASFSQYNSLFILNSDYVDQSFYSKKKNNIIFGHYSHIDHIVNKISFIWSHIVKVETTNGINKDVYAHQTENEFNWNQDIWSKSCQTKIDTKINFNGD
jgi:hypothetical protein